MDNNEFFKFTPLYKEFIILDLIDKDPNITQRMISDYLCISLSMTNSYIDEYEKKRYLEREYISSKNVKYHITKKGVEQRKVLNIGFLNASQKIYDAAKENILFFINQILDLEYKKILLYGAGEVAEILLQVIQHDKGIPLDILAVIDDDSNKQGNLIVNTPIISVLKINDVEHDCILISSFTNNEIIFKKLINSGYDKKKILSFFEL